MAYSDSRLGRRRKQFITAALALVPTAALGTTFTDPGGDNYGPSYVDIASVNVTSDATNLTFQINLNPAANLLASDGTQIYGKYQIGFQTGEAGNTTLSNPFGNPIGISSGTGMDYWVGSWADNSPTPPFSGGAALYHYAGATATQVAGIGYSGTPFIDVPVTLAATSTTIVVPLSQLGLAQGDTFKFDVWSTFGIPGGQSAYDALGKATLTTDPGTPYANPTVTAYDSGTNLLTYTVGGATPVVTSWLATAGGSWATPANWASSTVPNGVDHSATFGSSITAPSTVTLDGAKTVGTLTFNSANAYTIAGTDTLTIDTSAGSGAINVQAGSHNINTPVTFADDTVVTVTPAASTLAFHGALTATGRAIGKAGAGTATFVNVRAASLAVQAGAVRIPAQSTAVIAAGTSVVNGLSISGGATLDLTNNALIIDYTAGSIGTLPQDVRALLQAGRLVATGLPAVQRIGYFDNAVGTARATFGGLNVDASSLLIAATVGGDANLDRTVNFDDLVVIAQNYNTLTGGVWQRGDFNYDAKIDFDDLVILAQNYNVSAAIESGDYPSAFAADWALAQSLAPEPSALAMLGLGMIMARRRAR